MPMTPRVPCSYSSIQELQVSALGSMSRAFLALALVAHVLTLEVVEKERFFRVEQHLQPNVDAAPIRSVVTLSPEAAVVAWTVAPGQRLPTHRHPRGQDTCAKHLCSRSSTLLTEKRVPFSGRWTVLQGVGEYVVDAEGTTRTIQTGDIVVARTGDVHGVLNTGDVPLVFVSLVTPSDAGHERL